MSNDLVMPWRAVALWLTLLLVAVTTTLVITVTVKDVDLLSTVALALAVFAFAAQLASNVVQGQASSQQMVQGERLNNETQALLTEIRTTTANLRGTVENQFETLLKHALREAVPETLSESAPAFVPAEFERRLFKNLDRRLEELSAAPPKSHEARVVRRKRPKDELDFDEAPKQVGDDPDTFKVGDRVAHLKFGAGTILDLASQGAKREARVGFDEVGEKTLLLSWAPLVKTPTG